MTGTSKKPPCRCPRCVRRRIQFLTLSGAYIALAAGFYLVIGRSKLAGFPSLDTPAISVREASVVLGGIGRPGLQGLTQSTTPATQQDAEMLQETLGKGDFSAGSLELTKDSKRPDGGRHRGALPSSNPLVEAPPHTNGWQTVPLADASDDDVRWRSESDDAKVFMQPGSSPAPPLGESTFRPSAEADPSIAREDVITTYNSETYELLPRRLKELQRKPYDTFKLEKSRTDSSEERGRSFRIKKLQQESTTVAANSPVDRPKSEKPDVGPLPEPVVAQSEKTDRPPETTTKETIARAETGVAADSIRLKTSLLQLSTSCVPKTQDYKFNNSNAPIEN